MKKKKEKVKTFTLPDLSTLTLKQCSILMVIALISFLALRLKFLPYIVSACVFTIPMTVGLVLLNKDAAKKLIRLPKGRDFLYGFGFVIPSAVITMIVTVVLGVLGVIEQPKSNVIFEKLANDFWLTLAGTFIQLFGEEMITLIVFLFTLKVWEHFFSSTKGGIVAAFFVSAVVFGAIHYPTYLSWAHVLFSISTTRLLYNFVFLRTKNLTASFITHLTYDYILFAMGMMM